MEKNNRGDYKEEKPQNDDDIEQDVLINR